MCTSCCRCQCQSHTHRHRAQTIQSGWLIIQALCWWTHVTGWFLKSTQIQLENIRGWTCLMINTLTWLGGKVVSPFRASNLTLKCLHDIRNTHTLSPPVPQYALNIHSGSLNKAMCCLIMQVTGAWTGLHAALHLIFCSISATHSTHALSLSLSHPHCSQFLC